MTTTPRIPADGEHYSPSPCDPTCNDGCCNPDTAALLAEEAAEHWTTGAREDQDCAGTIMSRNGSEKSCLNRPNAVYRTATGRLHPLCARCAHTPERRGMTYVRLAATAPASARMCPTHVRDHRGGLLSCGLPLWHAGDHRARQRVVQRADGTSNGYLYDARNPQAYAPSWSDGETPA
jgi:hypothetical protein